MLCTTRERAAKLALRTAGGAFAAAAALTALATLASAAAGGPDSFGYRFVDSAEASGPSFKWDDVASTGTAIALGDDELSAAINIGFTFPFYGVAQTQLRVCSNGYVTFPSLTASCGYTEQRLPDATTPNEIIAGYWDDLAPNQGGTIHYETRGTSPNRVFIVQFTDVLRYNAAGTPSTFAFKLHECKPIVEVHYKRTTSGGQSHSAGIENSTGLVGLSYFLADTAPSNTAVRYYTGSLCVPSPPRNLAAAAGPDPGSLSISWEAPDSDGGSPITGYRVFRATTAGGAYAQVASLGVVSSFVDAGLGNGAARHYKVAAVTAIGEGDRAGPVIGTTWDVPGAPASLTATTGPGVGEISLAWQPPASDGGRSVSSYRVSRADSAGGSYAVLATLGSGATSFKDTGLPTGTTRHYRVTATNAIGEGPAASASARSIAIPDAPRALQVTAGPGAGELGLAWQAPVSDGGSAITAYNVYRAAASGGPYSLVRDRGAATTFTDSGLGNAATRFYVVSAVNVAGESASSGEATARTFAVPGTPASLAAARGTTAGTIALSWTPPGSDGGTPVTAYRVYRGPPGAALGFVADVGDVRAFTDSGLAAGSTHCYAVAAVNLAGEGVHSASSCATAPVVPGAPRGLAASTGPGAGEISLAWSPPADDGGVAVSGYRVLASISASGPFTEIASLGTALSYRDTGLAEGAARHYRVAARNGVGEGPDSATVRGTAPVRPTVPRDFRVEPSGLLPGDVTLAWSAPASDGGTALTGYRIDRGASPGAVSELRTVGVVTSYRDNPLTPGTYYYRIAAVNGVGAGPATEVRCVVPYLTVTTSVPCATTPGRSTATPVDVTVPVGGEALRTVPTVEVATIVIAPTPGEADYVDVAVGAVGTGFSFERVFTAGFLRDGARVVLVEPPETPLDGLASDARLRASADYDRAQRVCLLAIPAPCALASPWSPTGIYPIAGSGQPSRLTVTYAANVGGTPLAAGTATAPVAGQALAALP